MKEIKISEASKSHRDVLSNSSCPFFVWGNLSLVDPAVPWMLKSGQSVIVDTFSFLNLDSSSSPPPSSPTSSPQPTAPLSRRPPFCHLNYKHRHCDVRTVGDVLIFVVSTMAAIACQTTLASVMSAIVYMWWVTQIQRMNCAMCMLADMY